MPKIQNLRDAGSGINEILGCDLLKPGMLYRSGALNDALLGDLPEIKTILNLRREPDPAFGTIQRLQVAPRETMNNYVIMSEVFQEWIQRLYTMLADCAIWPLLMHCQAGKDRTGVAIALLLKNLGVPNEAIVGEYMRGDYGNRYPESMARLLNDMPTIPYLKMKESQIRALKGLLLQE